MCMKGFVPRLLAAGALSENLLRPFCYCHTSWRDSAPVTRQQLIKISRNWSKLGFAGLCPYLLTEELAVHETHYEDFETV